MAEDAPTFGAPRPTAVAIVPGAEVDALVARHDLELAGLREQLSTAERAADRAERELAAHPAAGLLAEGLEAEIFAYLARLAEIGATEVSPPVTTPGPVSAAETAAVEVSPPVTTPEPVLASTPADAAGLPLAPAPQPTSWGASAAAPDSATDRPAAAPTTLAPPTASVAPVSTVTAEPTAPTTVAAGPAAFAAPPALFTRPVPGGGPQMQTTVVVRRSPMVDPAWAPVVPESPVVSAPAVAEPAVDPLAHAPVPAEPVAPEAPAAASHQEFWAAQAPASTTRGRRTAKLPANLLIQLGLVIVVVALVMLFHG